LQVCGFFFPLVTPALLIFVSMTTRNARVAVIAAVFTLLLTRNATAQTGNSFNTAKKRWVDSVYNRLNPTERIGQLFMVAAYSGGKNYNDSLISSLLRQHMLGGLIFMQGGPARQANLTNKYQQMSQVPLLIGMDAEWGLGMRLDSVMGMPRQMMLGATRDSALMYRMGMAIAYQCRRLGVHIDFAPVVDVNNNPANPVINFRSFGEDKTRVARMGIAYMHGLQDNGVIACAKHFPGHGDTDADSHKELPVVKKSLAQLDTLELYPFRELIKAGVKSTMVAHLEVPAIETEPHVPTTLSQKTVTGLLREKMGFNGLIFTDALNMQGVAKYFGPGEVDLRAFIAGNDVLLFSQDVPTAVKKISDAIAAGKVSQADLEQRIKKILAAKYDAGLNKFQPISTNNIVNDLNQYTVSLRKQIAAEAITLVRDSNNVLGKIKLRSSRVAYIGVNAGTSQVYDNMQHSLGDLMLSWLPKGSAPSDVTKLLEGMRENDATIVAIHGMTYYPGSNYGLDAQQMAFIREAQRRKDVMLVIMGNPYFLKDFCDLRAALVAYDDDTLTQQVMANILLGKETAKGKLPVTPCPQWFQPVKKDEDTVGMVLPEAPVIPATPYLLNKEYIPENAGVVAPVAMDKLRLFIQRCIVDGAFPGCRILAARNGKVFFNEAFGYYTYDRAKPVDLNTMYDVASVTKVLSTTLAVMRLYEEKKLDLNGTIGDYLPWTRGTDKAYLRINDLLLHQAGLKSWIPFYKETLDSAGNLKTDLYRTKEEAGFNTPVARNLFLRNDYKDTIWNRILTSPLENKGRSVYSDLDFYFLAAVTEQITKTTLDKYVYDQFYKPLGLKRIMYCPLKKTDSAAIAPTEYDLAFRHELINGYVHDQGAAMLGGVAGHAGIFAGANDVAVIFQMLLNYGAYNGKRYFRKETVEKFIAYGSGISRRGLGFDKPNADRYDAGPTGERSSGYSFGHQGFTGTCVWADPVTGVLFVFLSNRVYPSAENNLINKLSVRTVAQDYVYEALGYAPNYNRPAIKKLQLKTY
jgi:beta-glucosidase-like glycosyl hydrolase/CubicO group peptidase (beta-lactamase class C family)